MAMTVKHTSAKIIDAVALKYRIIVFFMMITSVFQVSWRVLAPWYFVSDPCAGSVSLNRETPAH
jgi:hypothetical protein